MLSTSRVIHTDVLLENELSWGLENLRCMKISTFWSFNSLINQISWEQDIQGEYKLFSKCRFNSPR